MRGTEELTNGLLHTMEQEWMRESTRWRGFKGVEYTGREVLEYVCGTACQADCTPGRRERRKPSANGERRRSELGVVRVRERVELPGGPRAGSQNV